MSRRIVRQYRRTITAPPANYPDAISLAAQFELRLAEMDDRIKRVETGNCLTMALVAGFIAGALIVGIVAVIVVLLLR